MIDWQEARRLADVHARGSWDDALGEFWVADWGREDAEVFQVPVGAREFLEGGDTAYAEEDATLVLVWKENGAVSVTTYLAEADRLAEMTTVGDAPDDDA